jgi:hypothetical protein
MGISNPFAALAKVVTGNKSNQGGAVITPLPRTTVTQIPDPISGQLVNATPYDEDIQLLRHKVDALEGSKPHGIDAFKFVLMKWGAALLPIIAAFAVGDVVAQFFTAIGFNGFSAYSLSFVLELVTMLLTYSISHALTYRTGKSLNIAALLLTIAIWLLFLAAQVVLLIAIGGAHPGTLIFIAVVLRSLETALACTATAIVSYWTRGKTLEEELAIVQRKQTAFVNLHGQHMDVRRTEQRSANQQRQEEQHLQEMQRNSEMLVQMGEKIGSAVMKVMDKALQAIDDASNTNSRGW